MDADDWDEFLRPTIEGRRVILAGGPVAQWTERVAQLRRLGATDVFVMATGSVGTGPLPSDDECTWHVIEVGDAPTLIERIRLSLHALDQPPPDAVARLDQFDPDGTALVFGDFLNTAPTLGTRPFASHRRKEWLALEDKVTVDAFWDRAEVDRAEYEVVPASLDAVSAAADRLRSDAGVVLAGDAREGWHGGASLVRWADAEELLAAGLEALAPKCDTVRVMPFLEGVPCSIHGIVLPDGVVAVRPVEMVVLRKPDGTFFYAGCSTFWDPPREVRDEMRALARRVGERLRAEVDFRGAFTVDGVVNEVGFRPTELNPRNGAGLTLIARAAAVPVQMVLDAVVAGSPLPWSAEELETALVEVADRSRSGGTWAGIHGVETEPVSVELSFDGEGCCETDRRDEVTASMTIGPAHGGSFARTMFAADHVPVGPSVSPLARAVWQYADARFGLGIGPLAVSNLPGDGLRAAGRGRPAPPRRS